MYNIAYTGISINPDNLSNYITLIKCQINFLVYNFFP